jgi:hypothetical protein
VREVVLGSAAGWGKPGEVGAGEAVPGTAAEDGEMDFFRSQQNQGVQTFKAMILKKTCLGNLRKIQVKKSAFLRSGY